MRNLSRIAFVIALAACGDAKNNIEACELDPSSVACRCENDGTLPECDETPLGCRTNEDCQVLSDGDCLVGVCTLDVCDAVNVCEGDGVVSGEIAVFPQENGNTFLGVQLDFSESFDAFADFEEAEDAAVPIDGCIDVEFPNIDGEPDRRSVGDVTISKGGAPVTTLMFDAGTGRYEEIVTGLVPGDTLDVAFPGEGAIGQHNFIGFAAMPDSFPTFTGLVNNQLDLTNGIITYDPLTGSYIRISTSFIEGQTGVTLACGTDGSGMVMLPPATLARLPASGSLNLSVTNREYRALVTDDGVIRLFRSFVRMTKSVQYTKS
jgi:hypothetical protein